MGGGVFWEACKVAIGLGNRLVMRENWKDIWKNEALGELTVYDRTSLTDMQEVIDRIGDAEAVITKLFLY